MKFFVLELGVSNSKVGKQKLEVWVSNSKFYLILDKVELVTQKNNFSFILSHFSFILTPLFSLLSFLFIFLIHCFSSSHYCTCQCFLNNYYNVVLKIMYLFLSKNWFQLVQKQPLVGILKISFFLENLGNSWDKTWCEILFQFTTLSRIDPRRFLRFFRSAIP